MEKWKKIAAHIGAYPAALAKWLAVGALILLWLESRGGGPAVPAAATVPIARR